MHRTRLFGAHSFTLSTESSLNDQVDRCRSGREARRVSRCLPIAQLTGMRCVTKVRQRVHRSWARSRGPGEVRRSSDGVPAATPPSHPAVCSSSTELPRGGHGCSRSVRPALRSSIPNDSGNGVSSGGSPRGGTSPAGARTGPQTRPSNVRVTAGFDPISDNRGIDTIGRQIPGEMGDSRSLPGVRT